MKENEQFEIPESLFDPPTPVASLPEATPSATPLPAPAGITTDSTPWPPRLAFDVALGIDGIDILLDRYELDEEQLYYLLSNPVFQKQVDQHRQEIVENGIGFKAKARIQAETYLTELHEIIRDRGVSPATRLEAIKSVVKYAGLEPTSKDPATAQSQTTRLVFQWQDGSGQVAVEVKGNPQEAEEGN